MVVLLSIKMSESLVCSTEDVVHALLDQLVEPLLPPAKSTNRATPPQPQQLLVAKQMHAVVLLYNYYHRKGHQHLEFLSFEQFCKLAMVLKPTLMAYMDLMKRPSGTESSILKEPLSLTEKEIMDACHVSMSLDALTEFTVVKEWPILKVAVLLVDSRKENCFMKFGDITQGVWSIIEKDLSLSSHSPEANLEARHTSKRKRANERPMTDQMGAGEIGLQKVAFLAVKETEGIGPFGEADLTILESHVVYSLSKEKTATRFYIMQCAKPKASLDIGMPIQDAIDRLQGPLIIKCSNQWATTSVVDYFHVLPYARVISEWFSGKPHLDKVEDEISGARRTDLNDSERDGVRCNLDFGTEKLNCGEAEATKKVNRWCTNKFSALICSPRCKVDECSEFHSEIKDTVKDIENKIVVVETPTADTMPVGINYQGYYQLESKDSVKIQKVIASKEKILSEAALRVLRDKRNKLVLQQRLIEDEIAQCDQKILKIMTGSDDQLEIMIESVVEGCNDLKRSHSSESVMEMQNSCQVLDGICHEKIWVLPTYRLSQVDGGFQASINLKEMAFEFSSVGDVRMTTQEARESAATKMLIELRNMEGLAK